MEKLMKVSLKVISVVLLILVGFVVGTDYGTDQGFNYMTATVSDPNPISFADAKYAEAELIAYASLNPLCDLTRVEFYGLIGFLLLIAAVMYFGSRSIKLQPKTIQS